MDSLRMMIGNAPIVLVRTHAMMMMVSEAATPTIGTS